MGWGASILFYGCFVKTSKVKYRVALSLKEHLELQHKHWKLNSPETLLGDLRNELKKKKERNDEDNEGN
jgi:hypothetical protein